MNFQTSRKTRVIPEELKNVENPDFKSIMKSGGAAEQFARQLKSMKSNQLRKFFDEIKTIEKQLRVSETSWSDVETQIVSLIPQIKYNKGRKLIPEIFSNYMTDTIERILESSEDDEKKKEMFKNFVKILEAIVAYHKFHGGD